ncbi:MAG: DUF4399 domain-containing protein [Gammaproteobacteria bacterium]
MLGNSPSKYLFLLVVAACSFLGICATTVADELNSPYLAYIVSPEDGASVTSPVKVIFGLKAPYGVAPAGVALDNTGHHHLIIDADLPDLSKPIPKDAQHRHFGGGQTEATIELAPGEHTLQLILGDFKHVPHPEAVISPQIRITVK